MTHLIISEKCVAHQTTQYFFLLFAVVKISFWFFFPICCTRLCLVCAFFQQHISEYGRLHHLNI